MRIAGITLPENKRVEIALMAIYGIGRSRSQGILNQAKVDLGKVAKDISEDEENRIRAEIEKIKVEGDLKRQVSGNIKRLKDISAYRGNRHAKGITVRGQRTRTNARTIPTGTSSKTRKRATMGSGRVKVEKK
jgi:small subunit ribosomal protein S13